MKSHSYYVARQQEQHLGLTSSYPTPASLILIWFDSSYLQTICQSSVTPHTTTTCLCAPPPVSVRLMAPSFTSANDRVVLCSGACSVERHTVSTVVERRCGAIYLLFSSSNSNLSFLREASITAPLFSFFSFFF